MYTLGSNANILSKITGESIREVVRKMQEGVEGYTEAKANQYRVVREIGGKPPKTHMPLLMFSPVPTLAVTMSGNEVSELLQTLVSGGKITKFVKEELRARFVKIEDRVVPTDTEILRNTLQYQVLPPDKGLLSFINSDLVLRENELVRAAMLYTNEMVTSNGTLRGQMTRLVKGMLHNPVVNVDRTRLVKKLAKYFPRVDDGVRLDDNLILDTSDYTPTWEADAGAPFVGCKKRDVKIEMIMLAKNLLNQIKDFKTVVDIEKFDIVNRRDTVMKMKNKLEMMKKSSMEVKVRNYFVCPGALGLIFSIFQEFFDRGWKNLAIDKTALLIGHSSTHGGTEVLMNHLLGVTGGIRFKVYSDDITISFIDSEGNIYIMAVDAEHHDLSLTSQNIPVLVKYFQYVLRDEKGDPILTQLGENIMKYNVVKAFIGPVLVKDLLLVYFREGMRSGLPGTSQFGSLCSGLPLVELADELKGPQDPKHVETRVQYYFKKYGMSVKPGTEKAFKVVNEVGYESPFTILGMRMCKIVYEGKETWIPIADFNRLFASVLRPTKRSKGMLEIESIKYSMLRCFGMVLSGGYHFPVLYEIAEKYWNYNIKNVVIDPNDIELDVPDNLVNGVREFRKYNVSNQLFPLRKWFYDIYIFGKGVGDASLAKPVMVNTNSLNIDPFESVVGSMNWADIQEEEEEKEVQSTIHLAEQGKLMLPVSVPADAFSMEVPSFVSQIPEIVEKELLSRSDKREIRAKHRKPMTKLFASKMAAIKLQNDQIRAEKLQTTDGTEKRKVVRGRDKRSSVVFSDVSPSNSEDEGYFSI